MERAPVLTPALDLIRRGFASLARPPFRSLWVVGLLIAAASPSLVEDADDFSFAATVLFALITYVVDMAIILAAADDEPEPSGDTWVRGALRRRAFWRFVVAAVLTDLAVAGGLLLVVVGGVLVAGIVGLAAQAALLERRVPLDALRRSAELTRPGRGRIRLIYTVLVLMPTLPVVALFVTGVEAPPVAQALLGAIGTTFSLAADIALTRAYVELGGTTTPVEDPRTTRGQGTPPG